MKKKLVKCMLAVLLAIVLLVLLVFGGFALGERIMFWDFYANAQKYEKIPGLWSKFVPQGYNQLDGMSIRLACGYMSDGDASRIYVLKDDKDAVCVEMKNADGSDYVGHTGGIDALGHYVYVTADTGCDIFSLSDILDGDGIATVKGKVKTINDPAYCVINDGILYCGSFYRAGNYETPAEQRLTTPSGEQNTAIISAYRLDAMTGLPYCEYPDLVISTTGLVQGMTFIDDNTIALSTSYGLSKSHIYIHDIANLAKDENGFELGERTVPLYHLDSTTLKEDIIAPPMAEQIFYKDGKIYIMTESASMKYLFGKLTSGNYVYGYEYN